ncbi:MAG: PhnD/SsuA/transferrin family substrate-binding protein [Proteobacteria bacterium]|nr:PhnD/SsuA/transferrin family substrate-binding protein [Desulfobulbaceae bacterium]MBU4152630.1 PhnD/SsuA/transferrin family substrate-binding protein [Pseudomonadota bacterium]
MNKIIQFTCLALCLLIFARGSLSAAEPHPDPPPQTSDSQYTITVIPFYSPEKIWTLYTPFIDFLKHSTGKPWTLKLFSSHKALIDGLCNGQVTLALLGPVPLGRVMEQCNAEPVLVALSKNDTPFYRSIIVTTDPSITSLSELKGKKLGFFKGSTAAHIMPRTILRQAGLDKNSFVPVFFEGQDHIVNALLTRQVTAAGLKETLFAKFKDDNFRALHTSGQLPNFTFAASPVAKPEIKTLFVDTLLQLAPNSNESDRQQMITWDDEIKYGFTPPTEPFLNSVKDLLGLTNVIMREDR